MSLAQRYPFNPGWKLLISDMGCDYKAAMRKANIEPDDYNSSNQDIDGYTFYALWRAVEQDVGINTFSIKIAESVTFESLSPALLGCLFSCNMEQAFLRIQRYKPLIGPIQLGIEPTPEGVRYTVIPHGQQSEIPKSLGVTEIALLIQLARVATRKHIIPLQVNVAERHDSYTELEQFLGCAIGVGGANEFVLSSNDLTTPLLTENNLVWETLEKTLEESLRAHLGTDSTLDKVKQVIATLLPDSTATIDCVADQLAMSTRTLQRKLKAEESSFQEILQQTRKELAMHYLGNTEAPLIEVAFLLGYQDNNSFSRAFVTWCGTTPSQYRLSHSQ